MMHIIVNLNEKFSENPRVPALSRDAATNWGKPKPSLGRNSYERSCFNGEFFFGICTQTQSIIMPFLFPSLIACVTGMFFCCLVCLPLSHAHLNLSVGTHSRKSIFCSCFTYAKVGKIVCYTPLECLGDFSLDGGNYGDREGERERESSSVAQLNFIYTYLWILVLWFIYSAADVRTSKRRPKIEASFWWKFVVFFYLY